MKDYVFPKSIDELLNFGSTKTDKGNCFEDFLFHYYRREFDVVLYTSKYDIGVDLVMYNLADPSYRIGIQAKNFNSRQLSKRDIQSMTGETMKIYYLSEMRLVTTSVLNNHAKQFCLNSNYECLEYDSVVSMINEVNDNSGSSKADEDIKRNLYKLRYTLMRIFELSKPHHVFGYRTIMEIVSTKPKSKEDLVSVYGLGPYKIEKYGKYILELINE